MADRRSLRIPWGWGLIFFDFLAGYATLVGFLVAAGCPVYFALAAPPTITVCAGTTTLWLRQFLNPGGDPPAAIAGGGVGDGGPH